MGQAGDLSQQFLLVVGSNDWPLLIDLEVVAVGRGHDADVGACFIRDPDEVGADTQGPQAVLQLFPGSAPQETHGRAGHAHAMEQP